MIRIQRIRVRKHNAYKVRASIENGFINILVAILLIWSANKAPNGAGFIVMMGVALICCAGCEFDDAKKYNKRIGGYKKHKAKTRQLIYERNRQTKGVEL